MNKHAARPEIQTTEEKTPPVLHKPRRRHAEIELGKVVPYADDSCADVAEHDTFTAD